MELSKTHPYAIVQNAGQDNERVIKRFESYDDAISYLSRNFYDDEIEELGVDIMGVYENGMMTTEI